MLLGLGGGKSHWEFILKKNSGTNISPASLVSLLERYRLEVEAALIRQPTSIVSCCQKPCTKILDWNLQSCKPKETLSFYKVIASAILRCSWSTQFSACKERKRNPCQSSRRHGRALSVWSISNHTAGILLCILRMTEVDSAQAWFMPWKVQVISNNHDICATNWSIIIFMGKMQGNGQLKISGFVKILI